MRASLKCVFGNVANATGDRNFAQLLALEEGTGVDVVDSVPHSDGRQAVTVLEGIFANGFHIGGRYDFFQVVAI